MTEMASQVVEGIATKDPVGGIGTVTMGMAGGSETETTGEGSLIGTEKGTGTVGGTTTDAIRDATRDDEGNTKRHTV